MSRVLVTGGSRSGKSGFAESLATELAASGQHGVTYLATGAAPDPEVDLDWALRIARHRDRRPSTWAVIETLDIVSQLSVDDSSILLIDGIGTWLARTMDDTGFWASPELPSVRQGLDAELAALTSTFAQTTRTVIAVTDEVGSGVVPPTEAGRRFRDELGQLNIALARAASEVWLISVGLGQRLK
jgi:adenosylcobinamide kinase/adenosylcobinamide-phosphate guanylyltransferase